MKIQVQRYQYGNIVKRTAFRIIGIGRDKHFQTPEAARELIEAHGHSAYGFDWTPLPGTTFLRPLIPSGEGIRIHASRHPNLCRDLVREPFTEQEWEQVEIPRAPTRFIRVVRECGYCGKVLDPGQKDYCSRDCQNHSRRFTSRRISSSLQPVVNIDDMKTSADHEL